KHYIDKTEILNIQWLEYIYHKRRQLDSAELYKVLPDSTNFWFALPENRYKPVVLITYEQATEFCAWRSEVVSKRIGREVVYRLPTPAERSEIAREVLATDRRRIEKQLEETKAKIQKAPGEYLLIKRETPKPRVYGLLGNVSEMTLEEGVALGSNNLELTNYKADLYSVVAYDSANSYLGFRCVAEMK